MSWLRNVFALYIEDVEDDEDGVLFYHPPAPAEQQHAFISSCRAAASFMRDFAPEHPVQIIEVGDAKLALSHDMVNMVSKHSGFVSNTEYRFWLELLRHPMPCY